MIAKIPTEGLTGAERSQLERKELARGAWAEGRPDDALLIIDTVLSEEMTPRVAVECYVTKAAFLAETKDFRSSLEYLNLASPMIDLASLRVRRGFYHQRGVVNKELGDLDRALNDYTGAVVCAETEHDRENEGAALLNLANVYLLIGDFETARENLSRSFQALRESKSRNISQAYDTLANIELAEGHAQLAIIANNKAFDLIGDNESWRATFESTRLNIRGKLLELLEVSTVEDIEILRADLVMKALIQTGGNLSHAGKLVGLSYKGVDYIVQRHPALEQFRTERKPRLKSLIKKS